MNFPQAVLQAFGVRPLSVVDSVIIHHSVANKTLDIVDIDKMEKRSPQDFIAVGYHCYTKCLDPTNDIWAVQMGRPVWAVPAAAYGYNLQSYDICIGGNYEPGGASFLDVVSEHALKAVAAQILVAKKKLPNLKYLMGHRDVATLKAKQGLNPEDFSTACPGQNLYNKLHELRLMTGLATHPGL